MENFEELEPIDDPKTAKERIRNLYLHIAKNSARIWRVLKMDEEKYKQFKQFYVDIKQRTQLYRDQAKKHLSKKNRWKK